MKFKIIMFLLKIRHPKAGYHERVLLYCGYTRKQIDEMEQEFKDVSRESLCKDELYYSVN